MSGGPSSDVLDYTYFTDYEYEDYEYDKGGDIIYRLGQDVFDSHQFNIEGIPHSETIEICNTAVKKDYAKLTIEVRK